MADSSNKRSREDDGDSDEEDDDYDPSNDAAEAQELLEDQKEERLSGAKSGDAAVSDDSDRNA